jgi:hypothetical protein
MSPRITIVIGAVVLAAAAPAEGQRSGSAFTATGTQCADVQWSEEALRQYPRIATACRDVLERDGKYYVRFEGEVQRVADRGRQLTIAFRDGDRLTLTPPENLALTIDGRRTRVSDLRPGDELRFYVPQDQLAASFFTGQPAESPAEVVPIGPPPPAGELLAQTQQQPQQPQQRPTLPRTASSQPLVLLLGALFTAIGAALAVSRRARRRA